jgi:hypothetical protein
LEGSIDYDEYLKYYNFLEKMTDVLLSEYLSNKDKIAKSYLIGLALRELLFTFNRDEDGLKVICGNGILSNINIDQYQSFSLMNSMLSDYISGKIEETKEEKEFGEKLLQSSVFKKFINEDINIKEILTKPPTSKSINTLKNDSLKLIILIKNKIVADRKSTTNVSSSLTSTISQNSVPTIISSGRSFGEGENLTQTNSKKRSRDEITGGVLKTKKRKYKRILKTKQRNSKKNEKKGKNTKRKRKGKGNKKTRKH